MTKFGGLAEWLGSGLQNRVHRFESGIRLVLLVIIVRYSFIAEWGSSVAR